MNIFLSCFKPRTICSDLGKYFFISSICVRFSKFLFWYVFQAHFTKKIWHLFRLCSPSYVLLHPITEHVKNKARETICIHYAEGTQTENIQYMHIFKKLSHYCLGQKYCKKRKSQNFLFSRPLLHN